MAENNTRTYSDRDMMRMQQDAVARVREMQERARQTVADDPGDSGEQENRSWSTNPNTQRRSRIGRQAPRNQRQQREQAPQPPRPEEHTPPPPPEMETPPPPGADAPSPPPPPKEARKKDTTILQDIFGAIGLDDDRLLIAGLILILINDRADTTLILALCYLLI